MIRKLLSLVHTGGKIRENRRNHEIQRIETFSDGVFAFAVTLLIVSLEVPKSFEELLIIVRGFFAFGISFGILVSIWIEQHRFFRRYGMDDGWTITLNVILLFIVLFYVYPLKFLFSLLFSNQIYGLNNSPYKITQYQVPFLMMIYAAGFIIIYSLFFFMYLHAYRNASDLKLTKIEKFDCVSSMHKELIMALIGFLSFFSAMLLNNDKVGIAGYLYCLIPVFINVYYKFRNKTKRKLFPVHSE